MLASEGGITSGPSGALGFSAGKTVIVTSGAITFGTVGISSPRAGASGLKAVAGIAIFAFGAGLACSAGLVSVDRIGRVKTRSAGAGPSTRCT